MNFEWDDHKEQLNKQKHQISFVEAATIWRDPQSLEFEDNIHSVTELRFLKIGLSRSLKILIVSFCERSLDEHETIRLISARRATDEEKKNYEERI